MRVMHEIDAGPSERTRKIMAELLRGMVPGHPYAMSGLMDILGYEGPAAQFGGTYTPLGGQTKEAVSHLIGQGLVEQRGKARGTRYVRRSAP